MASITASLSSKVDARGKAEILLRVIADRKHTFRIRSGVFIPADKWNEKERRIVIRRLGTPEQRELLEAKSRLDDIIGQLLERLETPDRDTITKEALQETVMEFWNPGRIRGRRGLVQAFTEYWTENKRKESWLPYKAMGNILRRFERYRGETLCVEEVTAETLKELQDYMLKECELAKMRKCRHIFEGFNLPEERGMNSVVSLLTKLRTFYNAEKKVSGRSPFDDFEMGRQIYGTPFYLTMEERDAVYRMDLADDPDLACLRDVFIFQCLTGCRVGDLMALKKTDVVDGELVYMPKKTSVSTAKVVRVPLVRTAEEIVERYAEIPGKTLLPRVGNQYCYNKGIREVLRKAGVDRMVSVLDTHTREEVKRPICEVASSHLARRTFIGILYKKVKDPNLIGSMSGHVEGSRAFARYRAIDSEMKRDTLKILDSGED